MVLQQRTYRLECHQVFGGSTTFATKYEGRLYGPELEQFVVSKDGGLISIPLRDFERTELQNSPHKEVKPELSHCQLEVTNRPMESLGSLYKELNETLELVRKKVLHAKGLHFLPLSFIGPDNKVLNPQDIVTVVSAVPRYQLLASLFGKDFVYYATRVASDQLNVGANTEEDAFRIFNLLRRHIPIIAGFSAASPFDASGKIPERLGTLEHPHSQRLIAYKAAVSAVERKNVEFTDLIPPSLDNLEDYVRLVNSLKFPHTNTLYHFIRPMPHRGVGAEIRVMDKQPSLADTMAMFALIKGIVESGRQRNVTDLQLGQELEEAVANGIFCQNLFKETLTKAKKALPRNERGLLEPLELRLLYGTVADSLVKVSINNGLDSAIFSLISSFSINETYTTMANVTLASGHIPSILWGN